MVRPNCDRTPARHYLSHEKKTEGWFQLQPRFILPKLFVGDAKGDKEHGTEDLTQHSDLARSSKRVTPAGHSL